MSALNPFETAGDSAEAGHPFSRALRALTLNPSHHRPFGPHGNSQDERIYPTVQRVQLGGGRGHAGRMCHSSVSRKLECTTDLAQTTVNGVAQKPDCATVKAERDACQLAHATDERMAQLADANEERAHEANEEQRQRISDLRRNVRGRSRALHNIHYAQWKAWPEPPKTTYRPRDHGIEARRLTEPSRSCAEREPGVRLQAPSSEPSTPCSRHPVSFLVNR